MIKYTFIHPTKTGGTACYYYFNKYYSEYIITNINSHHIKCNNDNNPIIIVRDPYSRFLSMFYYWKYGSMRYKRNSSFLKKNKPITILDFIQMIKNNDTKNLYVDHTWNQHFSNISDWIPDDTKYENIIVIKYDKNLNVKIQKLLNLLNIPNKNVPLIQDNVSIIDKNDQDHYEKNKQYVHEFIDEYFKRDLELIDKINHQPNLFKLVI
jgi:hypothetical protein